MISYLQIDKLTKSFGDLVLFEDITFGIAQGQKVGLIAKNGTGKTTLLNIIAGKEDYDSGAVVFRNDLRVGYLEQMPHYPDGLTVLQACFYSPNETVRLIAEYEQAMASGDHSNLEDILLRMDNLKAWDYEQRTKQILGQLKIHNFDQKVETLSGGQLKRVALANVLITDPELIILDEPTVGLDPAQMIEIRSLIRDLGKTHTVILSSHILSEVQTVCDRVLIIAHGRLVAQGTPEELAAQLTAKGTITATAQGSREAVVAAAGKVPGLTDLRVTDEKGGEVSFTAVSTAGTDLRGALSLALAQAGCPVLSLSAETMSLEDVFLQLTETPESGKPESTAAPAENPPAEAAAEEANEKEANSDESNL